MFPAPTTVSKYSEYECRTLPYPTGISSMYKIYVVYGIHPFGKFNLENDYLYPVASFYILYKTNYMQDL